MDILAFGVSPPISLSHVNSHAGLCRGDMKVCGIVVQGHGEQPEWMSLKGKWMEGTNHGELCSDEKQSTLHTERLTKQQRRSLQDSPVGKGARSQA